MLNVVICHMEKNRNKVKITITYDVGWQKRSPSRRYESSGENAFIISGISKGIIGFVLYLKAFQNFDAVDKMGEEAKEHEFPNNFEGISKTMDAGVILKMV